MRPVPAALAVLVAFVSACARHGPVRPAAPGAQAQPGGSRPVATAPARAARPPAPRKTPAQLRAAARVAYAAGDPARCAALFEEAARAPQQRGDACDAARCAAQAGDRERAFRWLDAAVSLGFRDPDALVADGDLEPLHTDARWPLVVEGARARRAAWLAGANAELLAAYEEDQADRRAAPNGIDWSKVTPRDEARRARVERIVESGAARTAADHYHAAMVFQHGKTPEDFDRAHALAEHAAEMAPDDDQARWLAAAAEDRAFVMRGLPQRFGTQYRKVNGRWQLYDVDPAVTDDERAAWAVPPLECARHRAEQMNKGR